MEFYKKQTFTAGREGLEPAEAFIRSGFPTDMSSCDREAILSSCREILDNIAWADKSAGSIIIALDPTPAGFGVQFLHCGPIFNPCPSARQSFTRANMDEVSYEFKYGRNALSVFRKKHPDVTKESENQESEATRMADVTVRNHTLKSGSKIASVREFGKKELLTKIKELAADPSVDAVEWRIDEYEDVFEVTFKIMPETIAEVREALGDKILMYTFRDKRIGGAHPTNCMYATRLNNLALKPGAGDLVTVEWYNELDQAIANVTNIHDAGKLAVASWCTEGSFCEKCVEKKLNEMLESKCDVFEYGALCTDDKAKQSLKAGAEAFKKAHPEIPVILSAKDTSGNEEKTVL